MFDYRNQANVKFNCSLSASSVTTSGMVHIQSITSCFLRVCVLYHYHLHISAGVVMRSDKVYDAKR